MFSSTTMYALGLGVLSCLLSFSRALPSEQPNIRQLSPRAETAITNYIALGESYATGVGVGVPDKSVLRDQCLRYSGSYPRILEQDPRTPGPTVEDRLTNNACSGHNIEQIIDSQLPEKPVNNGFKPFGKPQFAVMSAGGDDVEFKELVLSCIYEFPYKPRKCADQIAHSQDLITGPDNNLVGKLKNLIQMVLDKGKANHEDFKIYFPSYLQFFNTNLTSGVEDFCSNRTWSRGKFWQRGLEKLPLTIDLRNELNGLAVSLNQQIQAAVDSFANEKDANGRQAVRYFDWNPLVEGHRYCESGKQEPVNDDPDIWFFQASDKPTDPNLNFISDDDPTIQGGLQQFYDKVAKASNNAPNATTLSQELIDGTQSLSAFEFLEAEVAVANAVENQQLVSEIHAEGLITQYVVAFHPKGVLHQAVEDLIIAQVVSDFS